jgi:hypothetical protein
MVSPQRDRSERSAIFVRSSFRHFFVGVWAVRTVVLYARILPSVLWVAEYTHRSVWYVVGGSNDSLLFSKWASVLCLVAAVALFLNGNAAGSGCTNRSL